MALMANINRDPKKKPKPFLSSDFDPMSKQQKQPVQMASMDEVKRLLKRAGWREK